MKLGRCSDLFLELLIPKTLSRHFLVSHICEPYPVIMTVLAPVLPLSAQAQG